MALKAAAEAAEPPGEDYSLAQAILDGACISLPHGSLVECYDELGTRYAIPVYCLSRPLNLAAAEEDSDGRDSPAEHSEPVGGKEGEGPSSAANAGGKDFKVRVRVSLTGSDVRMIVNTAETVAAAKRRLHQQVRKMTNLICWNKEFNSVFFLVRTLPVFPSPPASAGTTAARCFGTSTSWGTPTYRPGTSSSASSTSWNSESYRLSRKVNRELCLLAWQFRKKRKKSPIQMVHGD